MVVVNISQIAVLNAKYHKTDTIYFCGSFLRNSDYTQFVLEKLSWAINFWSENKIQALFLNHDYYLGAMGAMLSGIEDDLEHSGEDVVTPQARKLRLGFFSISPPHNCVESFAAHNASLYFDSVDSQAPSRTASIPLKEEETIDYESDHISEDGREDDFIDLGMLAPPHPNLDEIPESEIEK